MSYNDSLGIPISRSNNTFQVTTPSGYGSTNTVIRRYSVVYSAAPFVEYRPSAVLGDSFVIKKAGLYYFQRKDDRAAGALSYGISVNATAAEIAAGDIATLSLEKRIIWSAYGSTSNHAAIAAMFWCKVGDVVRCHDYSGLLADSSNANSEFRIIQVIGEDFSTNPTNYGFHANAS